MAEGNELGEALMKLREQMSDADRAKMDEALKASLENMVAQHAEMSRTMTALAVLHREGTGERAGFCAECGNVAPCQTLRFIGPFVVR